MSLKLDPLVLACEGSLDIGSGTFFAAPADCTEPGRGRTNRSAIEDGLGGDWGKEVRRGSELGGDIAEIEFFDNVGVKASRPRKPEERSASRLSMRKAGLVRYLASILKEPNGWGMGGKVWVSVVRGGDLAEIGVPIPRFRKDTKNIKKKGAPKLRTPFGRSPRLTWMARAAFLEL